MTVRNLDSAVGVPTWNLTGLLDNLANWSSRPRVNVGLVLGTSTSWMVRRGYRRPEASCLVPGKRIRTGLQAARLDGREPVGVALSRPFFAGRVQHREHAVALVRHWLRTETPWGAQAVVAVPHDLTPAERRTVEQVVLAAGAQQVYLVDESLAAGLGAGLSVLEPKSTVLMDLGASSTRISVMALGKVTRSRVLPIGGDALNEAIVDFLVESHGMRVGLPTAERVKQAIGCAMLPDAPTTMQVDGICIASGLPRRIQISAAEVCGALQSVLASVAEHLRFTIEEVQSQLIADGTPAVTLVGGGARLAQIATYLRQHIHLSVHLPSEADGALAAGLDMLLQRKAARRALLSAASTQVVPTARAQTNSAGLVWALGGLSAVLIARLAIQGPAVDAAITSALTPAWQTVDQVVHPAVALAPIDPVQRQLMRQLRDSQMQNAGLVQQLQAAKSVGDHLRSLVAMPFHGRHLLSQVVARDPNAWLQSMTVKASDHVQTGMAVVSDEGLVGLVTGVSGGGAQVRTLSAAGATLAAVVEDRRAPGVLYGINGHLCELRFLNPNAGVQVGDVVRTRGDGWLLGRVTELHPAADGVSWTATVRPSVPLDTVSDVMIVPRSK